MEGSSADSGIVRKTARGRPFEEGHPKRGGRKPGTPNKVQAELETLKADAGTDDPLAFLRFVMMHGEIRWDLRTKAAAELAKYMYAQKRDVHHSGEVSIELLNARLLAGRKRVAEMPKSTPTASAKEIRVREKATGDTGYLPENEFKPELYEEISDAI